jgi:hypothetical protein
MRILCIYREAVQSFHLLASSPSHFHTDDVWALLRSTPGLPGYSCCCGGLFSRPENDRDAVGDGNADDTAAGTVADMGASEISLGQTAGQIVGRILAAGQVSLEVRG